MAPDYSQGLVKRKNHITAGLLAVFLGAFGVHKFYLGYNQAGFATMAVTVIGGMFSFGLAAAVMQVIAFIEAGIYFTRTQDAFEHRYVTRSREWF